MRVAFSVCLLVWELFSFYLIISNRTDRWLDSNFEYFKTVNKSCTNSPSVKTMVKGLCSLLVGLAVALGSELVLVWGWAEVSLVDRNIWWLRDARNWEIAHSCGAVRRTMVVTRATVGRLESILDHLPALGYGLRNMILLFDDFNWVWIRSKLLCR